MSEARNERGLSRFPRQHARLASVAASLVLVTALWLVPLAAAAQSFLFNTIRVEGTQRIDAATVLSYAAIPRGQEISAGALNDAYQRLLDTGLFESVEIVPRGGVLVIAVSEFPTIGVVNFEGNRRLDDDELAGVIESRSRRIYNPSTAERDAETITRFYAASGRFAASVEPRIIRRPDNVVDLVFEITEGRVVEVERIAFSGNRAFSDRRLRQVLETKQAGIFRTLIQRDTFVEERIEFDKRVLRDFYLSRGYVDFEVQSVSAELSRERDAFFLTFTVREGQQFSIGNVSMSSTVEGINAESYGRDLRLRSGAVYSPADIDNVVARIETRALREGYDFVRVEPRIRRNSASSTLDVEFAVIRGPRIFVERIDIEGNVTTLDRVVRRQFRTVEGDPFNPREIREAAERIRALGFFSTSDVQSRPGSTAEQVVIDVNVEEQTTGSLSFGASYSAASGAGFAVSLVETNFLGRGQTVSLRFDTVSSNAEGSFTFIEPAFLDRDVEFRFGLGYRETDSDFSRYATRNGNIDIGLGFPLTEISRLKVSTGLRYDNLLLKDGEVYSPILEREAAEGERFLGKAGYEYTYDTRLSGLDPNFGFLFRFGQDFYAGDATYVKTSALGLVERRVWNEDLTLRAVVQGGAINVADGTSRVTDRYFGSQMRGFEPRGIGPRDIDGDPATDDDPLGGNFFAVASLEAEFPLGLPEEYGITGGLFLDVGSVWGLDDTAGFGGNPVDDSLHWRSAAGFSIFWTTPIGPLRFNFSAPIEKLPYDREQNFDFTISTRF